MAATLLLGASAAQATPIWSNGDLTTYSQVDWGTDPTAESVLSTNYDTVYASTFGLIEIGIPGAAGYSLQFTDAPYVLNYLPATGSSGALDADLVNPTSTSSGGFGGVVLALRLDIDFSDAGVLPDNAGIPLGDLVLTNFSTLPSLNGMTVRDLSAIVNTLLGGGSNGYTISDAGEVAREVTLAFQDGVPSTFAIDHLMAPTTGGTTGVPEPSTVALFGVGLLGLVGIGAKRRRILQRPCSVSS